MPRSRARGLHGSAPDHCPVALLLIDWINDLEFRSGERLLKRALPAAKATARLRARARRAGVPVIYCNDNFGKWRSDFRSTVRHCLEDEVRGEPIARLLEPDEEDYFVLKPKHSGFHSTSLEVLLAHLGARTLVLTGIAGNICVLFTAHDAYMRDFGIFVPPDCIASERKADDAHALQNLVQTCKASVIPSDRINFARLRRGGARD